MARLTAWSVKPLAIFSAICGIPSDFRRNQNKFIYYLNLVIVGFSLTINGFSSYHYLVKKIKFVLQSTSGSGVWVEEIPIHLMELIFFISASAYNFGVPFFTSVNFYFRKWQNICKRIEEMEEKFKFSPSFFTQCRKLTIISILLSILELSLFIYITPQNSENSPFAMFNILESFGIKEPVRNITIGNMTFPWTSHANLPFIPKTLTKLSGFWLQSSIIAVFTAFFVYIWIVSFIADDFDKQLIETEPSNWNDDPLIFENWWTKIEYFNSLVEGVNDFFGVMLLLNLFHTFMYSSRFWGFVYFNFNITKIIPEYKELKSYLEMIHIYFRLIILAVGAHRLKMKGIKLGNSLNRIRHEFIFNQNQRIQLETVILKISGESPPQVTALDIINLDIVMLSLLFKFTLTYSIVLHYTTSKQSERDGRPVMEYLEEALIQQTTAKN